MIIDYFKLAFNNLKKRGLRSWLTMLGIFIGIAAVVSLISLGNGLQTAITGQFSDLDPNKLVIQNAETGFGPPGSTAVKKLTDEDLQIIKRVNGVDVAFGRLVRIATVEFNEIRTFNYVANIPENQEEIDVVYDALNVDLEAGRLLTRNDRGKVVLGNDFTDKETYEKQIKIGDSIIIQGVEFEVVGVLKKGQSFTINSVIIMAEDDLKDILNIGDEIDLIIAQVEDQDNIDQVARDIERALRKDRNLDEGEEDFSVQTPQQSIQAINTILGIINLVVVGIAAISLLIGGVGITNTMYTSVLERTKEIGVMKAVGAKNSDILSIFLIESAFLGLAGGIIGAIIGLLMAFGVSAAVQSAFPGLSFGVTISPILIISSISFSFIIGSISGLLPAIQASKLKPVDAFRK